MGNLVAPRRRTQCQVVKWWCVVPGLVVALAVILSMRATPLLAAPTAAALTENALQEPDHGGHGNNLVSHYGILDEMPDALTGTWLIGGESYTVTEHTEIELKHGPLAAGLCIEVKVRKGDPNIAVKIESKAASKCDEHDDDHDDDHHGNHDQDDRDKIKRYGILDSRPDEITGIWIVDGESYTVTEGTELEEDHGALVPGVCVEVEVRRSDPTVATEIESESEYKCRGRERDDNRKAEAKLFGIITALPEDLDNGEWTIGNTNFVVSPTTRLVSKHYTFTVGVTVKVDFYTGENDVNYARKIEIKYGRGHLCHQHNRSDNDDHDSNDDGMRVNDHDRGNRGNRGNPRNHGMYGYCPGDEGKTYGLIEIRPTDTLTGEWQIGGVIYLANAQTRFYQTDDLQVGERVRIEYVIDSNGNRLATKIQESLDDGGLHHPHHSKLVGFVDAKPEAFIGEWVVGGVPFEATTETIFLERAGIFEVGAYVVVEYSITGDTRVIYEIRTHVPPGAGESNLVGRLESVGDAQVAGVLPTAASTVWTVSGVNYVVTEATQLVDAGGELAPGVEVMVNSFADDDGNEVATSIRLLANKVYIPAAAGP